MSIDAGADDDRPDLTHQVGPRSRIELVENQEHGKIAAGLASPRATEPNRITRTGCTRATISSTIVITNERRLSVSWSSALATVHEPSDRLDAPTDHADDPGAALREDFIVRARADTARRGPNPPSSSAPYLRVVAGNVLGRL